MEDKGLDCILYLLYILAYYASLYTVLTRFIVQILPFIFLFGLLPYVSIHVGKMWC